MRVIKRKLLERNGWKVGDPADFLEMTDVERHLLDARVQLAVAVREQREAQGLTQKELGVRLKTTQPRIAKIERAASDVSLDQLVRAFTAAGGKLVVKSGQDKSAKGKQSSKKSGGVVFELSISN